MHEANRHLPRLLTPRRSLAGPTPLHSLSPALTVSTSPPSDPVPPSGPTPAPATQWGPVLETSPPPTL